MELVCEVRSRDRIIEYWTINFLSTVYTLHKIPFLSFLTPMRSKHHRATISLDFPPTGTSYGYYHSAHKKNTWYVTKSLRRLPSEAKRPSQTTFYANIQLVGQMLHTIIDEIVSTYQKEKQHNRLLCGALTHLDSLRAIQQIKYQLPGDNRDTFANDAQPVNRMCSVPLHHSSTKALKIIRLQVDNLAQSNRSSTPTQRSTKTTSRKDFNHRSHQDDKQKTANIKPKKTIRLNQSQKENSASPFIRCPSTRELNIPKDTPDIIFMRANYLTKCVKLSLGHQGFNRKIKELRKLAMTTLHEPSTQDPNSQTGPNRTNNSYTFGYEGECIQVQKQKKKTELAQRMLSQIRVNSKILDEEKLIDEISVSRDQKVWQQRRQENLEHRMLKTQEQKESQSVFGKLRMELENSLKKFSSYDTKLKPKSGVRT